MNTNFKEHHLINLNDALQIMASFCYRNMIDRVWFWIFLDSLWVLHFASMTLTGYLAYHKSTRWRYDVISSVQQRCSTVYTNEVSFAQLGLPMLPDLSSQPMMIKQVKFIINPYGWVNSFWRFLNIVWAFFGKSLKTKQEHPAGIDSALSADLKLTMEDS